MNSTIKIVNNAVTRVGSWILDGIAKLVGGADKLKTLKPKLKAAQAEVDRISGNRDEVNQDAADRRIKDQRCSLAKDPSDKNFRAALQTVAGAKEIAAGYRSLHETLSIALDNYHKEVVAPLCIEVLEIVEQAIAEEITTLETREKNAADRYGVAFERSPTLAALQTKLYRVQAQTASLRNGHSAGGPRQIIGEYIEID
jgi:hypothetical protein